MAVVCMQGVSSNARYQVVFGLERIVDEVGGPGRPGPAMTAPCFACAPEQRFPEPAATVLAPCA